MQKLKSFFLSLLYFVVLCIFGLIVGIGIAYGFLTFGAQGAFSSWELLSGNHQFEKIITADPQTVWAQASDGKVYSWNANCYRENCDQWVEAKEIPENSFEYATGESIEISNSCNTDDRARKTPGRVIECAHVAFAGAGYGIEVYYALIDDGTIWMWKYSGSSIGIELTLICGCFFGINAGIFGFVVFMLRRATKSKRTSASPV